MGDTGSDTLGRVDAFVIKATLWWVKALTILFVPFGVLISVYSTNPGRPTPLGWTLQAVLMGVGVGTLGGIILGAIIGVLVGSIYGIVDEIRMFVTRRRRKCAPPEV